MAGPAQGAVPAGECIHSGAGRGCQGAKEQRVEEGPERVMRMPGCAGVWSHIRGSSWGNALMAEGTDDPGPCPGDGCSAQDRTRLGRWPRVQRPGAPACPQGR